MPTKAQLHTALVELAVRYDNAVKDSIAKSVVMKQLEADTTKTAVYGGLLEKYTECSSMLIEALSKNEDNRRAQSNLMLVIEDRERTAKSLKYALRKALCLVRINTCGGDTDKCTFVTGCLCKQWWDTVATGEPCAGGCEGCSCEHVDPDIPVNVQEVQNLDERYVTWASFIAFLHFAKGTSDEEECINYVQKNFMK